MHWGIPLAVSIVFAPSLAAAASVATVQTMEGSLSLNRGDGYVEVLTWADAAAGSQVMANPGSRGKVIYSDGCEVELSPGSVYAIQQASPCKSGLFRGGAAKYVVGGLLVAGGVVAVVALTGGDDGGGGGKKRSANHAASP
jgi:hypothetical protein